MVIKNKILPATLLVFLACAISLVGANEKKPVPEKNIPSELTISGAYYKATIVTYADFQRLLIENTDQNLEPSVFFSDIKNHTIKITESENKYIIKYTPNLYEGYPVKGGGAQYEVSKDKFKIIKKEYYE